MPAQLADRGRIGIPRYDVTPFAVSPQIGPLLVFNRESPASKPGRSPRRPGLPHVPASVAAPEMSVTVTTTHTRLLSNHTEGRLTTASWLSGTAESPTKLTVRRSHGRNLSATGTSRERRAKAKTALPRHHQDVSKPVSDLSGGDRRVRHDHNDIRQRRQWARARARPARAWAGRHRRSAGRSAAPDRGGRESTGGPAARDVLHREHRQLSRSEATETMSTITFDEIRPFARDLPTGGIRATDNI